MKEPEHELMPGMELSGDSQVRTRCFESGHRCVRGHKPQGFDFCPHPLEWGKVGKHGPISARSLASFPSLNGNANTFLSDRWRRERAKVAGA
jgi:hypothetical protein